MPVTSFNVPIRRKRVPPSLFLAIGTTAFSIWYLLSGPGHSGPGEDKVSYWAIFVLILGYSLFLLTITLIDLFRTLYSSRVGLTLAEGGIEENMHLYSLGAIPWNDISWAETGSRYKHRLLLIMLHEPKKYIAMQPFWKRYILDQWHRQYGTPIVISQTRLDYDITILKEMIISRLHRGGFIPGEDIL